MGPPRTPFPSLPPSPVSSEHSYQRSRDILGPVELSQLTLTASLISDLKLCFPNLLSKQGWDTATAQICYIWSLKNPRTALLLYMTGNLASWPLAAIFAPITDSMMPFSVQNVEGIVGPNAAKSVVHLQRKVNVRKIMEGDHAEVHSFEDLPFQTLDIIQQQDIIEVDTVRWFQERDEKVQVRKTIICTTEAHRTVVENEIQALRKLRHPTILAITASYVQGDMVGLIFPPCSHSLAEYLRFPPETILPQSLKRWMKDLVAGLTFLHSSDVRHRDIRPSKILISGEKVLFASFGISKAPQELSGERYIFAAPEVLTRNKRLTSSDVFSLACVFTEMITVLKSQTLSHFQTFRTTNGDSSFASNIHKTLTWLEGLGALQTGETEDDASAIALVRSMLAIERSSRPKMAAVKSTFEGLWVERGSPEQALDPWY
jgi:serine/threonine protein kinase